MNIFHEFWIRVFKGDQNRAPTHIESILTPLPTESRHLGGEGRSIIQKWGAENCKLIFLKDLFSSWLLK